MRSRRRRRGSDGANVGSDLITCPNSSGRSLGVADRRRGRGIMKRKDWMGCAAD
jgi:hypothetical protein